VTAGTTKETIMTENEIEQIKAELRRDYPGVEICVLNDGAEIVAEVEPKRAVAVIECSLPHFHRQTTEQYKVVRGTLQVTCAGQQHVLGPGQSLRIEPGQVHEARGADGVAWVEVRSDPAWTKEDHILV